MFFAKRPLLWLSVFLFGLSLWIRYRLHGITNLDTAVLEEWYVYLRNHGFAGLGDNSFSIYSPLYLFMIWLSTLFSKWFGPLAAIKIVPSLFDLLSATVIFKLARRKTNSDAPYLLAAIFFILPTVMLNSSAWGQIDGMYTACLLLCVYFLLKKDSFWALAAFGLAFSVKPQAIFLLPFLGIMLLRGLIRWKHFFLVPAVYLLSAVPVILAGRSWASVITLYGTQVGQFEDLAKNAPNPYVFIPNIFYHPVLEIGLGIFVIGMTGWAWVNWKAGPPVTERQIMLSALASLALVPFLLPKMHDRYFYPADVFAFASAIVLPEFWFLSVFFQLASGITYTVFLFGTPPILVALTAAIMAALVILIVRAQVRELKARQV